MRHLLHEMRGASAPGPGHALRQRGMGMARLSRRPEAAAEREEGDGRRPENTQDLESYAPRPAAPRPLPAVASGHGIGRITLSRRRPTCCPSTSWTSSTPPWSRGEPRDVKLVVLGAAGKYFSAGFELGDHLGPRLPDDGGVQTSLSTTWPGWTSPWRRWWAGPPSAQAASWRGLRQRPRRGQRQIRPPEIKGGVFNPWRRRSCRG